VCPLFHQLLPGVLQHDLLSWVVNCWYGVNTNFTGTTTETSALGTDNYDLILGQTMGAPTGGSGGYSCCAPDLTTQPGGAGRPGY
jgi:hypothetical protein